MRAVSFLVQFALQTQHGLLALNTITIGLTKYSISLHFNDMNHANDPLRRSLRQNTIELQSMLPTSSPQLGSTQQCVVYIHKEDVDVTPNGSLSETMTFQSVPRGSDDHAMGRLREALEVCQPTKLSTFRKTTNTLVAQA
jgi:hypothetical protein